MISHSKTSLDRVDLGYSDPSDAAANRAGQDGDLQQRVRLFLEASNLPGLRHIQVEVQDDTVILRGQVRTFYEKQLASRLSRRVAGVIHVVDSIEVRGYVPRIEPGRTKSRRNSQPPRLR